MYRSAEGIPHAQYCIIVFHCIKSYVITTVCRLLFYFIFGTPHLCAAITNLRSNEGEKKQCKLVLKKCCDDSTHCIVESRPSLRTAPYHPCTY